MVHRFTGILFFVVIIIFACKGPEGPMGPQGPAGATGPEGEDATSLDWTTGVNTLKDDVYLIGFMPEGQEYVLGVGTGWALNSNQIITNAHVAYGIYDYGRMEEIASMNGKVVAVKNHTFAGQAGTYELLECSVHPGYNNTSVFSPDFAVFTVGSALPSTVQLASDSLLETLEIGTPIGTYGFPGELGATSHDGTQPIATFKDGTISALRPFSQSSTAVTAGTNAMLQFNLSTTGGTSGSPLFVSSGEVIGINNSGMVQVFRDYYGQYVRIPAGELDFGIRMDEVDAVLTMPYQVDVANFSEEDPDPTQPLAVGEHRITLDWNSTIDFDLWVMVGGTQFVNGFLDTSRAHIYPFTVHHGDADSYGPEQMTVTQLSEEITIFAERWTTGGTFEESQVQCEVTAPGGLVGQVLDPPAGDEMYWVIGTLSAQGEFQVINELTNLNILETSGKETSVLKKENLSQKDAIILKKK